MACDTAFEVCYLDAISGVSADVWDTLFQRSDPFVRHAYLSALELSNCVGVGSGWQVSHLVVRTRREGHIAALMPLYIKSHSFGEYLFDWSWAEAYQKHGLEYYPKLVSAIPFTPVAGERLAIARDYQAYSREIGELVTGALQEKARQLNAQTVQCFFYSQKSNASALVQSTPWLRRRDVQFYWFNDNYTGFSDYLGAMTARKRKSINKERARVSDAGIHFQWRSGAEMDAGLWQQFLRFYQATYAKRSGHFGYLNQDFFTLLGDTMAEDLLLLFAKQQDKIVAAALFFCDRKTLYGRYWGCEQEFDFLHFEVCYYQGIAYCIRHGLSGFNAGVQGEHKVARGFTPVFTCGAYQILRPDFHAAIRDFLQQEDAYLEQYHTLMHARLPFKERPAKVKP
ncbi:GNAT family N-acetyltransferase [Thalassomonas viridans]|uniref:GNAT family N-acetyltransferase n=1 Tax=Thalassomonas viridans TaxID=137584 RepID=A0AAE9Z0U2_9GAMM|nr:GNAT family N-acetyltransferase [Thalassomonas viridans]WDE03113.1 GNAT family N-acetyltransferase [Thalassomonas viridans]